MTPRSCRHGGAAALPALLALLALGGAAAQTTVVDSIGSGTCTSSTSAASPQIFSGATSGGTAVGFVFKTPPTGSWALYSLSLREGQREFANAHL